MNKYILFLGFGINSNRKEAVAINFHNHIKFIIPGGTKPVVYSLSHNYSIFKHMIKLHLYVRDLYRLIDKYDIKIVHDLFVLPSISLLFRYILRFRFPELYFIKEIHNNPGFSNSISSESLLRFVLSSEYSIRKIVSVYEYTYSRSKNISKHFNINYIPQYVPISDVKREVSFDQDQIKICYLGHPLYKKGVDLFPELISEIAKANLNNIEFNFAFSDLGNIKNITSRIKKSAVKTNIKIHFFGQVDAQEFFRKNHFFILPLVDEFSATSTPNVLLEAMEAGCIVLCAKNKATEEVIKDGVNGIFLKGNRINQIVDIIKTFATETRKYDRIGTKERDYILSNYSADYIKNRFSEIYG